MSGMQVVEENETPKKRELPGETVSGISEVLTMANVVTSTLKLYSHP
jgi:hypothetical protein